MKKIIALVLAMMMVFALCACGGSKTEAPAEAPAAEAPAEAPAAEAPEAPAEGEPSGEASGAPVAELFPSDGYEKSFEGYKQYAEDALRSDEHAPAEIVEMTAESIRNAADGSDESFGMMIYQGRILSFDDFMAE